MFHVYIRTRFFFAISKRFFSTCPKTFFDGRAGKRRSALFLKTFFQKPLSLLLSGKQLVVRTTLNTFPSMGKYRPLACRFSKSPSEPRLEMKNVRLDGQRGRALTAALFPLSAFHKKRDGVGAFVPFSLEPSPNETLLDFVLRCRKGSLFFGGEAPTFTLYIFWQEKWDLSLQAAHPDLFVSRPPKYSAQSTSSIES